MKKICVVTGSRAEYGLLRPLVEKIACDPSLTAQLVVTGMHLSGKFGNTYKEILKDGFRISKKVRIPLGSDAASAILGSMGGALKKFAKAFETLKPDVVVVLGDRFEIFSAAVAAYMENIPIAHIHGGEVTAGVFDEAFRHSITKMSCLHFTAAEEYRKRVIQLGEPPDTVFNVGALGIDNIKNLNLLSMRDLERSLGFKLRKHNLLVTFHPVTLERKASTKYLKDLLAVISGLKDTLTIFTMANADPGGRAINGIIRNYVLKNGNRARMFASLGQSRYLSLMKYVDAIVGNSSSGIMEAPSLKIGTINIGDRQKGRICAGSVINCAGDKRSIEKAFKELYSPIFQKRLAGVGNPFGDGNAAGRIKAALARHRFEGALKKYFYDL